MSVVCLLYSPVYHVIEQAAARLTQQHGCVMQRTENPHVVVLRDSTNAFLPLKNVKHSHWPSHLTNANMPSFAVSGDQLTVAADSMGLQPLYYAQADNLTVYSCNTLLIRSAAQLPLLFNEASLAAWLAGMPDYNLSPYAQVQVLPAGWQMVFSEEGSTATRYWDINPDYQLSDLHDDEYVALFKSCLQTAVADTIQDQDDIATQMSGGLDSTSVTALLWQQQQQRRGHTMVLSHLYAHGSQADEQPLIEAMRAHLGIEKIHYQQVDAGVYRDFLSLYPAHADHPGIVLSPRYADELAALPEHIRVMLTGNGGDEICWGHSAAYSERFMRGEWRVVPEVFRASRVTGQAFLPIAKRLFVKPLLSPWLRQKEQSISLPCWLTTKSKALATGVYEQRQSNNPFCSRRQPVHHARYNALKTTSTFNSIHSYARVAASMGIEVRHPFFNQQLVELSFAVPSRQLIRGPYPKYLLRRAMNGILPDDVCWRIQKTTFDGHFARLVRENHIALRQCLSHPLLESLGLINNTMVLQQLDALVDDSRMGVHVDLLFAILTQRWVQAVVGGL